MAISQTILCVMLTLFVSEGAQVTPVQKVLQMMNEIKQKGIEEKEGEEVTYTKFSTWCVNTDKFKNEAIQRGAQKIEELKAGIAKNQNDATNLGLQMQKLDELTDAASKEKAGATNIRETDKADYEALHADHVTSLEDVEAATDKLKHMMASGPGAAASFVQTFVRTAHLNEHARRILTSFLETSSLSGMDVSAPEAHKFDSQSGGLVDMMAELQSKLQDEDAQLTEEEMDEKHKYQMLAQTLTDQIEKQTATHGRRASTKKAKEAEAAAWQGELEDTEAAKDADEKYLDDLKAACAQKTAAFESRLKLRAEELEALDKAIEIIGDGAVSGASEKHLPQFYQVNSKSLAQLRNGVQSPAIAAVASFLKFRARSTNSHILSALALRVSNSPFKKIVKMVKDMIMKLTQEATDEAEHKGFCDTELTTNKQTRDSKSAEVAELSAEIEGLTAKSQKLSSEIGELSSDISSIDAAVAKATEIRHAEKEKNTATIADAKGAIAAVSQATKVLNDFYAKAAGATALAQIRKGVNDDMPDTFDKPFKGMGGEGGIVGMLEVILSDFQRLEADTTENETASAAEFEAFSNDSAMDKAVKGQEVKNREGLKQKTDSASQDATGDLQAAQAELDAAMDYYEKLKPSCVDAGISYEDRVRQRKEEIQSLQEALKILSDQ